jgi:hypothetical protein
MLEKNNMMSTYPIKHDVVNIPMFHSTILKLGLQVTYKWAWVRCG